MLRRALSPLKNLAATMALLAGFFCSAFDAHAAPAGLIEKMEAAFKAGKYKSIEELQGVLPPEYRQHPPVLAFDSASDIGASLVSPRIFQYSNPDLMPEKEDSFSTRFKYESSGLSVVSFAGDAAQKNGHVAQFLELNPKTLEFNWAQYDEKAQTFRIRPAECLECHSGVNQSFKPIWRDAYPDWAGFFGQHHNGFLLEKKGLIPDGVDVVGTSHLDNPEYEIAAWARLKETASDKPRFKNLQLSTHLIEQAHANTSFNDAILFAHFRQTAHQVWQKYVATAVAGKTGELTAAELRAIFKKLEIQIEGQKNLNVMSKSTKESVTRMMENSLLNKIDRLHTADTAAMRFLDKNYDPIKSPVRTIQPEKFNPAEGHRQNEGVAIGFGFDRAQDWAKIENIFLHLQFDPKRFSTSLLTNELVLATGRPLIGNIAAVDLLSDLIERTSLNRTQFEDHDRTLDYLPGQGPCIKSFERNQSKTK